MTFFRHFTVKKTWLPLPAERLFCLHIYIHDQWVANDMDTISKECLWKKGIFASKFLVYRGKIKVSETFFRLILSPKKWIPQD